MVELIEKTIVSDDAIKYLEEVEKKFKGEISRGWIKQDYLTAPSEDSEWKKGREECSNLDLIERADNGHGYIRYKISERGYKVLKLWEEKLKEQ